MASENLKRKLAAILSADVKGYSRLMGEDEEWTLRTLNNYKGIIRNLAGEHRGRVVGSPGDNILAEFASVVDAVQCAVEIQQVLKAKNALLPETRRMEFRIGINLGDVIEEGDSIYGDGVNIAARLEGLAEPGGICISGSAFEQIENKIPLHYDYLGEHQVKNIVKPVQVYKAQIEPEVEPSRIIDGKKIRRKPLSRWVGIGGGILVIALAITLFQFVFRPSPAKKEIVSTETFTKTEVVPKETIQKTSRKILMIPREGYSPATDLMINMEIGVMTSLLKNAGFEVDIATPSGLPISGHTQKIENILKLVNIKGNDYAGIIMPCMAVGGFPGPPVSPEVIAIVKKSLSEAKPVAASTFSGIILAESGVLKGKKYAFPRDPLKKDEWGGNRKEVDLRFKDAIYSGGGVVQDGKIITSGACPSMAKTGYYQDKTAELTQAFISAVSSK